MFAPYEGDRNRSRTLVSCSSYPLNFPQFGYFCNLVPEGLRSLFMAFEEFAVLLVTAPHGAGTLPAGRWAVVSHTYVYTVVKVGGWL